MSEQGARTGLTVDPDQPADPDDQGGNEPPVNEGAANPAPVGVNPGGPEGQRGGQRAPSPPPPGVRRAQGNLIQQMKFGHMPSDPIPPAGDITIQVKSKPRTTTDDGLPAVVDEDYIVYPNHLCFTYVERESNLRLGGISSKIRRIGKVAPAFANWERYTGQALDRDDNEIRFIGVSYDGVTDGKGAREFPDEQGRFAVAIQGAVTIFCKEEDLRNANVGDYLRWEGQPANFKWTDGSPKFQPVRIQPFRNGDNQNRIFGVLLEKGSDTGRKNEARVLLNPCFGNVGIQAARNAGGQNRAQRAVPAELDANFSGGTSAQFTNSMSSISLNQEMVDSFGVSGSNFSVRQSHAGPSAAVSFKEPKHTWQFATNALLTQTNPNAIDAAKAYISRETGIANDDQFYQNLHDHIIRTEGDVKIDGLKFPH